MEPRLQYFLEDLKKELDGIFPEHPIIWAIERSIKHCLDKWQLEDNADDDA
jgi:hypothetical protein